MVIPLSPKSMWSIGDLVMTGHHADFTGSMGPQIGFITDITLNTDTDRLLYPPGTPGREHRYHVLIEGSIEKITPYTSRQIKYRIDDENTIDWYTRKVK